MHILVNHAELTLKGQNRAFFENKLAANIKYVLGDVSIDRLYGRFMLELPDTDTHALEKLARIAGIANAARVDIVRDDIEHLERHVCSDLANKVFSTFAVRAKREDKSYKFDSHELNVRIGDTINTKLKKQVNLTNPDITIYIERHTGYFLYYTDKIAGTGGLPVGTGGNVLSLLSGGIDSPVSSYLMARRGCTVHFLHFHAFPDNETARASKMLKLANAVNAYTLFSTITFVPYTAYQMYTLNTMSNYELILFRRFMLKVAEAFAKKYGYQALVTGDNLGQVASQTLENLVVTEQAVSMPVIQPLITYTKEEIITRAKAIGTYDLSIQHYKDCCSIIQQHPKTKARLDEVLKDEEKLPIDSLVKKTVDDSLTLSLDRDTISPVLLSPHNFQPFYLPVAQERSTHQTCP